MASLLCPGRWSGVFPSARLWRAWAQGAWRQPHSGSRGQLRVGRVWDGSPAVSGRVTCRAWGFTWFSLGGREHRLCSAGLLDGSWG